MINCWRKEQTIRILHLRSGTNLHGPERVILSLGRYAAPDLQPVIGGLEQSVCRPLLETATEYGLETFALECRGRLDKTAVGKLREFLQESGIDILHAHDFKANYYALAAAKDLPVKKVATLHHLWQHGPRCLAVYDLLDAIQVRRFDRIIAVSPEIANQAKRWRIPKQKLRVIINGIDIARFSESGSRVSNGRIVVGSVGRLTEAKGFADLLAAAAQVCKVLPTVSFLIIGDGPLRSSLESAAARLQISDRIRFAGRLDSVEAAYAQMDIYALSSRREGTPIALLEAMASRLPIVATRVGAIPDVIEEGVSGLLVNAGDIEGLSKAIIRLAQDAMLAAQLGEAAYARVIEEFSAEQMTRRTEAVYRELTNA